MVPALAARIVILPFVVSPPSKLLATLYLNPTVWHDPSPNDRDPTGQGLHADSTGSVSNNKLKGPLMSFHLTEKPCLMSRGINRVSNGILRKGALIVLIERKKKKKSKEVWVSFLCLNSWSLGTSQDGVLLLT